MRVVFSKWGGGTHWDFPVTPLGRDAHGDWYAVAVGTRFTRPGRVVDVPYRAVVLVPDDRPWVAMLKDADPDNPWTVYVDMTTVPTTEPGFVRAVDLDLDVVVREDGTVYVDDEDEFAEHQVTLAYPADVVALALASRDEVLELVRSRTAPFDDETRARWLSP